MYIWDKKFDEKDYIYGKSPNAYVKEVFNRETADAEKILILAEGEGRNAVYLAGLGYKVTTFDLSKVGIEKQLKLASEAGVEIDACYGDVTEANLVADNSFDYTINVFGHVLTEDKPGMFNNLVRPLVNHGHSYFEFYAKDQVNFGTGGPKDVNMLYDVDEIKDYLSDLPVKVHRLEKVEVERYEGSKHNGVGSVIQGHIEKVED
ncbi:class I SAM-dependent methyltransferase [Staphylococcus debuckii]|uniref:class I SAM-dependent methyltransferase n=1 Tax=Staphylococcus debuckii TaxID=2044912 RepID=UPI000F42EBAB|nr:class I SAM-dependent methyltransferase [Staphylococcus debuckii]AYU54190.1 class I SAM-dependent methyltransferase [Staphylococcus debuckii]